MPYLEAEPDLREKFFARLKLNFFAGARLSEPVWNALDEIAIAAARRARRSSC
ncbi:hypothetical protein [Breoghania sp.]|uniref:hypothetical protein n=1 Tax=Breoghania sp. TaxID=2065378 RepID=UPI002629C617|nr:hypothetical protein [Breoghania sp.]MDJ0931615.1 hypothetical protein [Breoghania sp.]